MAYSVRASRPTESARYQKRLHRLACVAKTQTFWNVREKAQLTGNMEIGRENSGVFPIRGFRKKGANGGLSFLSSKLKAV